MSKEAGNHGNPIEALRTVDTSTDNIKSLHTREEIGNVVKRNPGTGIISAARYRQMFGEGGKEFRPVRFHPPEYVRVKISDDDTAELLTDGHHRTRGVYDHYDAIASQHPGFVFQMYDATQDTLDNPAIVTSRSQKERDYLTMDEYLIAVIVPTVEQEDIAPQRIAAKLMIGWSSLVGEEMSEKFSGLAALTLLETSKLNKRDEDSLRGDLRQIRTFFTGNTEDERRQIIHSAVSMNRIIKRVEEESNAKVKGAEIARAAFELVGKDDVSLGGREGVAGQVMGLLYHPTVMAKLTEAYGRGDTFRNELLSLRDSVVAAIGKQEDHSERGFVHNALYDPRFTIGETRAVINAEKPSVEFKVKNNVAQRRIVSQAYLDLTEKKGRRLSPTEEEAINGCTFVLRAGMPGAYPVSSAAEHIVAVVGGLMKLDDFSGYLSRLDQTNPVRARIGSLQEEMSYLRTKIKVSTYPQRRGALIEIDNLIRETRERASAEAAHTTLADPVKKDVYPSGSTSDRRRGASGGETVSGLPRVLIYLKNQLERTDPDGLTESDRRQLLETYQQFTAFVARLAEKDE